MRRNRTGNAGAVNMRALLAAERIETVGDGMASSGCLASMPESITAMVTFMPWAS